MIFSEIIENQINVKIKVGLFLTSLILLGTYVFTKEDKIVLTSPKLKTRQTVKPSYVRSTCNRLIDGNAELLKYYRQDNKTLVPEIPIHFYSKMTEDDELCSIFTQDFEYIRDYSFITDFELDFPIAFSFSIFKDIDRFARLLRIMYRPHNVYVIHIDKKASKEFRQAVEGLRHCLGEKNIHVLSGDYEISVEWGCYSSLMCYVNGMKYLIDKNIKAQNHEGLLDWKYFINLSGMEFPMRTNYEIVKILKALNNRNHIDLDYIDDWSGRFPPKSSETEGIKFHKGFVYIMVTREFCRFTINDKRAQPVYNALKKLNTGRCVLPDEVFFQTLYLNPQLGTPGGCRLNKNISPEEVRDLYRRMYARWYGKGCHSGKSVHVVCIFGIDDVPYIMKDHSSVIANKFYIDFQPASYDCMEAYLSERAEKQQRSRIADNLESIVVDIAPYLNTSMCL